MKRLSIIFYFISYYTGVVYLFYFFNRRNQRIFNYHHILPEKFIENNLVYNYSHSISSFKSQLELIKKRLEPSFQFHKEKSAIITFDDGALNNYTYAFPILQEYDFKSYFFVIEERLSTTEMLWVDKWFLWFSKIPYGSYNILGVEFVLLNENDRTIAHNQLWSLLRSYYHINDILEVMNQVYSFDNFKNYIENNIQRFAPLGVPEIALMKQHGHFIGSHGWKHDVFSLQDKDEIEKELYKIKASSIYNTKLFAVPFGTDNEINDDVIEIILRCGFDSVLLNQMDVNRGGCYGRINLPNTSNKYVIEAYLSGLHYFIKTKKLLS